MSILRARWLRWLLLSAAAAGLLALGYALGNDEPPPPRSDLTNIRMVVNRFAGATDARACTLLTREALQRVYGGRRKCIARSRRFEAGQVTIKTVRVLPDTAAVTATSLDGRTLFTVRLQKVPPGCQAGIPGNRWLISGVKERPNI
jgi:hypothetical protein